MKNGHSALDPHRPLWVESTRSLQLKVVTYLVVVILNFSTDSYSPETGQRTKQGQSIAYDCF